MTKWIVEKIPSDASRFMIHRRPDEAQAFGENGAAIPLSPEILNSIAGIKEPSKFIIDGYLNQEGLYQIFAILWWENTELFDSCDTRGSSRLDLSDNRLNFLLTTWKTFQTRCRMTQSGCHPKNGRSRD